MAIAECDEAKNAIEPLLKVKAIAQATGISRFLWYRLAKENKIPVYKCGKALRFKLSEILQWMKEEGK